MPAIIRFCISDSDREDSHVWLTGEEGRGIAGEESAG